KDHETLRDEARELMKSIGDKNREVDPTRKLSIVVEFVAGKITETIERMIALYRPDSLIVGTRGEKTFFQQVGQAIGPGIGSVSRYLPLSTWSNPS
ncbi:1682_t:CDS:1, partial [Acaulospora colombiana]